MKLKLSMFAMMLALATFARGATNDLSAQLQKGLFEEEANRDLTAAIANYQSLANDFDKDRQIAATAVFRLGECYRKLGKTNEAVVQYQRILKEFSDQQTLVMLSRQNLAGLQASGLQGSDATALDDLRLAVIRARKLVQQIDDSIEAAHGTNRERVLVYIFRDDKTMQLLTDDQTALRNRVIATSRTLGTNAAANPEVLALNEQIKSKQKAMEDRAEELVVAARRSLELAETAYQRKLAESGGAANSSLQTSPLDAGANVARLEAQIQNIEKMSHDQKVIYVQQNFPNPVLTSLVQELDLAQQNLIRVKLDYTSDHPKYKNAQELVDDLQRKLDAQVQGVVDGLKIKLAAAQVQSTLQGNSKDRITGTSDNREGPVTDEEQQEIRRIQLMIQNSPDLINAPGGGPGGNETPLIVAATKGQLVVAKYLLDHGAAVDAISGNHVDVALASAARNGHKAMVELLLSRGADVNGKKLNPLFEAVQKGYLEVAETLLAHNADVNTTFSFKPIHAAARNGRTELLQLLIKHGADVNATDDQGQTPLELAAMQSQTNCAKLLLDSKASIDVCDKYGMTPLHQAASAGSPQMVSLLLNSGATVDVTNREGTTPLMFAVAGNKAEAVRVLLEHKANPNRPGMAPYYRDQNQSARSLPIIFAIWKGNDDILKMLLDAGANAEGETPFNVPLFTAIDLNRVDAVQLLLEHGANPNRVFDGYPALNSALRNHKDARIASLLLDKGANANAKDKGGWVPLTETSDPQVGRWLVQHKADVNARIFGDVTALMSTQETNYIQFLVEAGAKLDLQDTNGNTALHHQTIMSNPGAVAFLLGDKANPNIQNNAGYTPLDLARSGSINGVIAPGLWSADSTGSGVNSANEREIADLLINAGGLANLPKRNRIEVRRASNFAFAFTKGSHDWNRYSLLEMIAGEYHLLSQSSSGEWRKNSGLRNYLWNDCLRFPDFKNVIVYRREDGSAKQKAINVDVEGLLNSGDCSRDMRLDWGDVIEIPESDHPVDVAWTGLSAQTVMALTNCLARQVMVTVKGVSTTLKLMPEIKVQYFTQGIESSDMLELTSVSFMLRSVLDNSKLVRVSSDLSRVKVTRMDPDTKKKQEWVIDCTDANVNQADLWLRDGDAVEVPEK